MCWWLLLLVPLVVLQVVRWWAARGVHADPRLRLLLRQRQRLRQLLRPGPLLLRLLLAWRLQRRSCLLVRAPVQLQDRLLGPLALHQCWCLHLHLHLRLHLHQCWCLHLHLRLRSPGWAPWGC
jgi:hypothetical protein